MIQISKLVLKFLRQLRAERAEVAAGDRASSALEKAVERSAPKAITQLNQVHSHPTAGVKIGLAESAISATQRDE